MMKVTLVLPFIIALSALPIAGSADQRTVNDALWIWAHPAGVYNDSYLRSLDRKSTIEPVGAAEHMGIGNMIFVCYEGKPQPPFEDYYAPLRKMDRVYWSMVGAAGATSEATREAAFVLAEENENIVGWILDDFFREPGEGNADDTSTTPLADSAAPLRAALTPEELRVLRDHKVRGRRMPVMSVIYTGQLKAGTRAHLAEIDELCLWTSRPADLAHLDANLAALEKLAPGKPVYLGCYMYDFHERKPLPVALMQRQVEQGYEWLKEGRIVGMIFLGTPNVDVGLEAVEWTKRWIGANGNQVIAGLKN
jgi:hypothetical protein